MGGRGRRREEGGKGERRGGEGMEGKVGGRIVGYYWPSLYVTQQQL